MIIWINGAFGAGKTTTAQLLQERLPNSFLYDPENLGFFLRDNLPTSLHPQDFQDSPEWRTGNVALLKKMSEEYTGDIIVPMALYKPHSVAEIIDRLKELQVPLCHFQLEVSESLLRQRLKERPDDQIT